MKYHLKSAASRSTSQHPRRGMVLLIVLVVVVLLSLGAYTFSEFMLVEAKATQMYGRGVQAKILADSGAELIAAIVGSRTEQTPETLYHNSQLFRAVLLKDSPRAAGRGRFSVVAPLEIDPNSRMVRFGLIDESAKLNLNALMRLERDSENVQDMLLGIPDMTLDIAEAILDFIDDDDEVRETGAEDEFYMSLDPPYMPKNGPLDSLDELLLVRGVTPEMLYGEDANRNGLLDPNENDGDASLPLDNADGILQRGWSAYLTVHSREINLQLDRSPRINVNQSDLSELYDTLEQEFGEEAARFVIAYRSNGPVESPTGEEEESIDEGEREQFEQFAKAFSQAVFGGGGGGSVTRGGIDVSGGGAYSIDSIYDLVGSQVQISEDGKQETIDSPWPADPGSMSEFLPELLDKLTTSAEQYLEGRVNINQAHREVLAGLPGMTPELAEQIVSGQVIGSSGESLADANPARADTSWLLTEGLVDLQQMRSLSPYITARGDVYRAQILGHFDAGGPVARIEAVIDATQNPPQVVFYRELSDLGRGYPPEYFTPTDQ